MKRITLLVVSIMVMRVLSGYAAEDKAKLTQKLDPIVITASRVNDNWLMYPDSATLLSSTRTVDVVDAGEIERTGVRTITDVLKNQLGIDVREYFGNGKTAQVDIRGFGETAPSNVLVMIDGRRTNQVDLSGVDWLQIDLDSVERIEILRGSQSVLYGDNAVGGVINIITKRGAGRKPELGINYETGSYHYNSYSGYSTAGTEFMDYYVGISSKTTDGYRGNSDLETDDFNANCTLRPADWAALRFDTGYHRDWYGQPGAVTDMQIERDGMRATDDPDNRGKTEDFYFMPGIDIYGDGPIGRATLSTDFVLRNRRTASLTYNAAIPAWGVVAYWYEFNNHIQTFGFTPKLVLESDIMGMANRLISGFDYYNYKDQITSTDYTNVQVGDGRQKDRTVIQEQTLGIYITDSLNIDKRLIINGGARIESAHYRFDQQAIMQNLSSRRYIEYAFDCGMNFKYNDRSAVYANTARSFRFPAVDEWYQTNMLMPWGAVTGGINFDLEPQTGMDYELGIRDNTIKWLKVNADYFIMDLRHELYYDPWAAGANGIHDHTMRNGVEVEAHLLPVDDLDIYGKYTYIKAFFVGSHYAGNDIPMVPRQKVTGGITYTFMDCVDFSYIFNFIGPRRFVSDQLNLMRQMKQYFTSDIKITYRKHGMEIYGAVNNMFDYEYSDMGSRGQYYPANGQNFLLGVKQKF